MTSSTVGIVVPVYNTDPGFLREAVSSALAQTIPVEVVLVDDCSTDEATIRALEELAAAPLAKLIRHEENRGPGVALNTGVEALDVAYVFALGSDDWVEPTYAELASELLDRRPEISLVTTDIQCFGASDAVEATGGAPNGVVDILFDNHIPGISVFRRKDWVDVGGFADLRWSEDYDFWVRILSRGGRTAGVSPAQYHYRIHPAQTTATTSWEMKLAQQLEIVRRNPEAWSAHIDLVMERFWSQEVELNYFKKRYGRFNDAKKSSIDAVLRFRQRVKNVRSR